MSREAKSAAIDAACFANISGLVCGKMFTPVPSRSVFVAAPLGAPADEVTEHADVGDAVVSDRGDELRRVQVPVGAEEVQREIRNRAC